MIWAAYGGRTETVELLILKNADVNAKSISNLRVDGEKDWEKGLTALSIAIKKVHKDTVQLLLEAGAVE